MSDITIDKDAIYAALKAEFQTGEFVAMFARLKELKDLGVDPFKQQANGTPEGWANLQEANSIVADIVHHGILVAEKFCADAGAVGLGEAKRDALAQWLDDVIALPFYLEPFDGIIIKFVISFAVQGLEKLFGKDWASHIPMPKEA